MNIDQKYPSVAEMEAAAYRRLPPFMRDYLFGALGGNVSRQKNRDDLNAVELMPRYLSDGTAPDIRATLFGRAYDAPFGVAPVGLSGLIWPRAERILAAAAKRHNIPYALSTVATASLEDIRAIAGEHAWYQLYTPKQPEVVKHLLGRCEAVGYDTLLLTVDVPYETRREQDIRSGLTVPPAFNARTVWQMVTRPEWALRMLASGVPEFVNIKPYFSMGKSGNVAKSIAASTLFVRGGMGGHILPPRFALIRDLWKGKLLVKGVLDADEAKQYLALGADGLVVSNHGGRQLDAAPSTVAALDKQGGDHVMKVLKSELRCAMGQIGCATLKDLPGFLAR